MKKTLLSLSLTSLIAATSLLSTQAFAVEGLSANVAATSNYLWRGVSQTDNAAAISGGLREIMLHLKNEEGENHPSLELQTLTERYVSWFNI